MKIKTVLAAAVIASTSTMSFAGNDISPTEEAEVFIPEATVPSSSSSGIILPAILGLLVIGALASSGGS